MAGEMGFPGVGVGVDGSIAVCRALGVADELDEVGENVRLLSGDGVLSVD
jgi:hypothetical protein